MWLHCLLCCTVAHEKYAVILFLAPLYILCLFSSLAAYKIFSLSLVVSNLILMLFGVTFFMFLGLRLLNSQICKFVFFHQIGECLPVISSNNLSLFFSPVSNLITFLLNHLNCLILFQFFSFFFLSLLLFTQFLFLCLEIH